VPDQTDYDDDYDNDNDNDSDSHPASTFDVDKQVASE